MGKRVTWKISGETSFQSSFICLFPAPPDAHNKYSIKTFLSKHSCSRSIPKKFPSVNFLLTIRSVKMIEMIFLFSPSTTLLSVRTKNLNIETFVRNSRSLAIIPALEIPLNVENNLLFFFFLFHQRNRRTISLQQHASILMGEDGKEISYYLYAGWQAAIHDNVSASTYSGLPRYRCGRAIRNSWNFTRTVLGEDWTEPRCHKFRSACASLWIL